MIIYVFLLFSLFLLSPDLNDRTKLVSTFFIFVLTSALLGLRSIYVGVDTNEYYWIYSLSSNNPAHEYIETLEPSFILINKMFSLFSEDASIMILFISVFVMLSVSIFIYRYSNCLFLAWLGFLSFGQFFAFHNVMRQSLAVAIVLFSVKYILNRNFLAFLLILLLAFSFHYSAIVFLPVYFFNQLKFSSYKFIFLWLCSIPFIFSSHIFINIFEIAAYFIPEHYVSFLTDSRVISHGGKGLGIRIVFTQFIIIMLIFSYHIIDNEELKYERMPQLDILFISVSLVALILANVFYNVGLITRLLHYYTIFVPIGIPIALCVLFKKESRVLSMAALSLFYTLLFFRGLLTDSHGIFPYSIFISM
ncbi:EpsG family protein [Vibrio satsumensis]|uniref:EpsG family protein n=1 Tax=Vibrio satsumensis TaxID=2910245 RepID=UPI003D0CCA84